MAEAPWTLGLDIGTSAVKAVVLSPDGQLSAQASAGVTSQRPRPGWSEQDAEELWRASKCAVKGIPSDVREKVAAIGLSGQMHGAVLLDAVGKPLRPVILWNDGRSGAECADLEKAVPESRSITGNQIMAGFTAPKLLWLARHEPETFERVAKVLLPKDFVRLRLTGAFATDLSDASGTMWLDVGERRWSERMLRATGLDRGHMPDLNEGNAMTGRVLPDVAAELGLQQVPVAAGGGDNASSACGVAAVERGQGFLSLGTSGVIFVVTDRFEPHPARGIHTFCHALPDRWHHMAVILSAASATDWAGRTLGFGDPAAAFAAAASHAADRETPCFLPHLSGERTPHNDPGATAVWSGLRHETSRSAMMKAAIEGVAFALADGADALRAAGSGLTRLTVAGGGANAEGWGATLATALDCTLEYLVDGDAAAATGAARLARMALTSEPPAAVLGPPRISHSIDPDPVLARHLTGRRQIFSAVYKSLRQSRITA